MKITYCGKTIFREIRKLSGIVFREELKCCAHFTFPLLNSSASVSGFLIRNLG